MRPAPQLPWYRAILPAFILPLLCAVAGAAISLLFPCDAPGLACLGVPLMGGAVGAFVGTVLAGVLGIRSGLRWWYLPLLAAGSVALAAGALEGGDGRLWWCAAGALVLPVAAGLVSSQGPGDWRRRSVVAALLAALAVGAVLVARWVSEAADAREAVSDYRQSKLPLYAPVHADGFRYRLIGASTQIPGRGYALYELRRDGRPYAIVKTAVEAPYDDCTHALRPKTLPDGLIVDQWGERPRVCRVIGPASSVVVYADHESPARSEAELVDLMRSLEPVDADWLAARG